MAKADVIKARDETPVYCAVCGGVVPPERVAQGAITCSKEHGAARANFLRARKESRECKYCHKPSTPEDRAAFLLFKKLARKRPDLLYPAEFEAWKAELQANADPENPPAMTVEAFAKWRNGKETDADDDERPTGPPAVRLPPMQVHDNPDSIYIFNMDEFGKKGQPCQMLKTRSKRRDIVQVRFADGYMPVVARSALRQRRPGDPEFLLDNGSEVESKLAASGNAHVGE